MGQAPAEKRVRRRAAAALPLISVAILIGVEAALVAPGHVLAADLADAAMVLILLNAAVVAREVSPSPGSWTTSAATGDALQALALVALARVVGFGLPLRDGSTAVGLLVIASLIGLSAGWLARGLGLSFRAFLRWRAAKVQVGTACAGLMLGLVAYLLGAPQLWSPGAQASRVVVALVAVGVASVVEELLFRGVVQTTLHRVAGRVALLASSALYAATYLDLGPAALVLVVALAGVVFAWAVARTGSLTGAMVGHALFALGAGGFWAALLGRRHEAAFHGGGATVVIAVALAIVAVTTLGITTDHPTASGHSATAAVDRAGANQG